MKKDIVFYKGEFCTQVDAGHEWGDELTNKDFEVLKNQDVPDDLAFDDTVTVKTSDGTFDIKAVAFDVKEPEAEKEPALLATKVVEVKK